MDPTRALLGAAVLAAAGCTGPIAVQDPMATLAAPSESPRRHLGAMVALDITPGDKAYLDRLEKILWEPLYVVSTREEAFNRLEQYDRARLARSIRLKLPNFGFPAWQKRLCELISERGWVDLSPALVSAWARSGRYTEDFERPEYLALVELHGRENVIDVVFELLVDPDKWGLRPRCWELLVRLEQTQRLRALLADETIRDGPEQILLTDLRAGAVDLGVFPITREEILWLQRLRQTQRAEFYGEARAVVARLEPERRLEMELRDLPIAVALAGHDPDLLTADKSTLYGTLVTRLTGASEHVDDDRFIGYPGSYGQRLRDHREKLTWGDHAALLMALRVIRVPEVVRHLFDYADRDREDKTCEYGGVIALDHKGRFEILEFTPRIRRHDNEFIASQAMLDRAYTGAFHFHFHAQIHRNRQFAGPGMGDVVYANRMRANCLVFTFVNRDTLNVDFYRYGGVIVDLGEVTRATSSAQ